MEQPLLRLGLLGFTESDKQKVLETIANLSEGATLGAGGV